MKTNNSKMFFGRVVGCAAVAALFLGCSAKTDPVRQAERNAPSVDQQQPNQFASVSSEPDRSTQPRVPAQFPHEPTQPEPVTQAPVPIENPLDELEPSGEPDVLVEQDPPKSFFRSIGRAFQRGVTDAAGGTSSSVTDEPQSDLSEPR